MLIHPSSGACDYLLRCCVGWLEACWFYVAGLSVGDVVSECGLNKCHLVGLPLFKYQDDARSNTHKIQLLCLSNNRKLLQNLVTRKTQRCKVLTCGRTREGNVLVLLEMLVRVPVSTFFFFVNVLFSQTLNDTAQWHSCYLIKRFKIYVCSVVKARNASDADISVVSHNSCFFVYRHSYLEGSCSNVT